MKNEQIKSYLLSRKNTYEKEFEAALEKEKIFDDVYLEWKDFNFGAYKIKIEEETRSNLKEWWINPEKGIKKEEELYAILFEYGHFFKKDVEADAYGIGKWKDYEVQTEEFDMGWNYDFTTEFYAVPGVSVNFFDLLEKVDYSKLPEQYQDEDICDIKGFNELVQLFKFSGMLAIHEVFEKMDRDEEFESLNYKNNFMFVINEHDSSEAYPLLIKEKK